MPLDNGLNVSDANANYPSFGGPAFPLSFDYLGFHNSGLRQREDCQVKHIMSSAVNSGNRPLAFWTKAYPPLYDIQNVIEDLKQELIPSAIPRSPSDGDGRAKRLVIVGDVHGHLPELKVLLERINFGNTDGDHLIFVGDLINKGPDSAGVVQLAMNLGASCVRGNNEDRVLLIYQACKVKLALEAASQKGMVSVDVKPSDILASNCGIESDRVTAASLSREQLEWLSSLPLVLNIGPLIGAQSPPWNSGSVVVVHAGLVPMLPLEKQDPWAMMNMRSLCYLSEGDQEEIRMALIKAARDRIRGRPPHWPKTDEDADAEIARFRSSRNIGEHGSIPDNWLPVEGVMGRPWRDKWNRWQHSLPPSQRTTVIYGHDALAGLQVDAVGHVGDSLNGTRYAFGLDSGCVYGRQLTVLVIEADPERRDVRYRVVQVEHIARKVREFK